MKFFVAVLKLMYSSDQWLSSQCPRKCLCIYIHDMSILRRTFMYIQTTALRYGTEKVSFTQLILGFPNSLMCYFSRKKLRLVLLLISACSAAQIPCTDYLISGWAILEKVVPFTIQRFSLSLSLWYDTSLYLQIFETIHRQSLHRISQKWNIHHTFNHFV